MTIRQLEYFCAVAEGRSISAAARALQEKGARRPAAHFAPDRPA